MFNVERLDSLPVKLLQRIIHGESLLQEFRTDKALGNKT